MGKRIGIDLGTANILVFMKGRGIIIREPSVIAYNLLKKEVLAVGEKAKSMVGRTPAHVVAIRPMKDGVIADFKVTEQLLKSVIRASKAQTTFSKPDIYICIPFGVTKVEGKAVEDAAIKAGAKNAYLVEEPIAAAIGAGLDITEPVGNMIVDIGGGTTEVAIMSLGGIVTSHSVRAAGDKMDESIITYIKKKYNIIIGERTAEQAKIQIGCAYICDELPEETMAIRGLDTVSGLPREIVISSYEVREAIEEQTTAIVDAVKSTLEQSPPELSADIIENGIYLSGGGALLKGLDRLIEFETNIKTIIAEDALDCVANGLGHIVEESDKYRDIRLYGELDD